MKESGEKDSRENHSVLNSYQWHCLVGGLAHELNNKIAPVLGFSSLLASGTSKMSEEKRASTLEAIQECAEDASRIIKTLLQVSKRPTAHRDPCDFRLIVQDSLEFVETEILTSDKVFTDRTGEDEEVFMVSAESDDIRQVVINLLLFVTGFEDSADQSWDLTMSAGEGFAVLNLEKLSEPEESSLQVLGGADFEAGLSLCAKLIERIGGRIKSVSDEGSGSTIRLSIPILKTEALAQDHAGDEEADAESDEAVQVKISAEEKSIEALKKIRVLVVDDEPFIAQILILSIEGEFGCHVESAENGRHAIEKLENGTYDLVVSDIRMPDIDGFDLFAWIMKHHRSLASRFLFITGDTGGIAMDQRLSEVPAPVLLKPFVIDEVSRECRRLLTPHGQN